MSVSDIFALGIPFLLFSFKELGPYILRRYKAKKDNGGYNEEKLKDINRKLANAVFLFPTDVLAVSIGYVFAKIVIQSDLITKDQINDPTFLHFWYFGLIIEVFFLLPLCVFLTRKCINICFDEKKRLKSILICVLLYLATFAIDLFVI